MRKRYLLVLLLLLAGCARQSTGLKDVLPVEVQRAWILKQTSPVPPEQAPEIVRSLGLEQAIEATYQGNGTITLRLFRMKVEASAFELIQKWRQQDGLAAYKGPYFFVATGQGPDQATVGSFLQALRQELK